MTNLPQQQTSSMLFHATNNNKYPSTLIRRMNDDENNDTDIHPNEMKPLVLSNVDVSTYNSNDDENHDGQPDLKQQIHSSLWHRVKKKKWMNDLYNWMYPVDTPSELQTMLLINVGLPISYFVLGICLGMISPLLNVYPIYLSANESQQTILAGISRLPAAFKMLYGFVSDTFPITIGMKPYRRKPYMFLGWLLCIISMSILYHNYDLHVRITHTNGINIDRSFHNSNVTTHRRRANEMIDEPDGIETKLLQPPSMQIIGLLCFLYGLGMWFADVMSDSMVAQKVRNESDEQRGRFQSTCYILRFFGLMIASPISTYLYGHYHGPIMIVAILIIAPMMLLPLLYILYEDTSIPIPSTSHQVQQIWRTICSRSVWQPIGFLYLFNVFQIKNAAWKQFLVTCYHFTSSQLNSLLVISYFLLYVGTMTYKYCLLHTNWRRIYQITIILNCIFSLGQLLLITNHIPFHMNPFWFALGDDSVSEFLTGIQFIPGTIMMISLCPPGSEAASYAMFTTVSNSAMLATQSLSTMLLPLFDVSKSTLESGDMNGMIRLTIVTTLLQTLPICFIFLLPPGHEELLQLSDHTKVSSKYSYSPVGGAVFLLILFGSMIYMMSVTIVSITSKSG